MCKTQHNKKKSYVLHSKAPIITTILHNSQQRQKKVYLERIYNSHVMNFCINSWESCDYWPQATVLNGSAWLWPLLLLLPLNCLHLTIFTVWMLLSQNASKKKKLCLFTNSSQIAQQLVAESRRRWRSFPSYQLLLLLLLKRNSCWITQFKRLYNCDLKLATLVLSLSALAVLFCACLTRCFSSAAHKDYLLPPRLCAVRLKREITNVRHFITFQSCCLTRKKYVRLAILPENISQIWSWHNVYEKECNSYDLKERSLGSATERERINWKNGAFTIVSSRPINVPWKINMHRFVPTTRCLLQIWNSLV